MGITGPGTILPVVAALLVPFQLAAPSMLEPQPGSVAPSARASRGPSKVGTALAAQDSAAILKRTRDAQADFERARRHHLPQRYGGSREPCHERIGRFCYWHGEGGGEPPAEPRRIREARAGLLATLDRVARLLPGDGWIAGQRVRYLVEDSQPARALAAVRECRAVGWWCVALAGFALHAAGEFAAADTTFAAAVRDMTPDERCRWTDLSRLLDDPLRRRYRGLPCDARAALEERIWRLADPLHLVPGNERRTEHFSRMVWARLLRDAESAYGLRWGDDLGELTARYGWPSHWSRERSQTGDLDGPHVVGHEPSPSFHFFPRTFDWSAWDVRAPRPRERYAPRYAAVFADLDHQLAAFRRGESTLVVAAYDARTDTLFRSAALEAGLALATEHTTLVDRRRGAPAADVLVTTVPGELLFASLELLAPYERRAARARSAVGPRGAAAEGVTLSDLLLFDPPDSLPFALNDVVPYVRASAEIERGRRLGLFWELYGLRPGGQVVEYSLAIAPVGRSWLRRAVEAVGLAGRASPIRMQWSEVAGHDGASAARALALDISRLAPGGYVIELAVEAAWAESARAARQIRVVGR